MTYTAVDIPFFTGQDESFDRKLLPVGPLRRVENAYQERTGRMVEKLGTSSRPTIDRNEGVISTRRVQNVLPNDYVTTELSGGVRTVGYPANGEVKLLEGSHSSMFGYEDTLRAAPSVRGSETFCPSVAVTSTHIIFAYCSGVHQDEGVAWHVDVYDRNTLKLIRSQSRNAEASQIKISASPTRPEFVIAARTRVLGIIGLYYFDNALADWPETTATVPGTLNSTFDLSDASAPGDQDVFYVVANISETQTRAHGFRRTPGLPASGQFTSNMTATPRVFNWILCGVAVRDNLTGFFQYTYHDGSQYRTDRLTWVDGSPTNTEFEQTGSAGAPCMSVRPNADLAVISQSIATTTEVRAQQSDNSQGTRYTIRNSFPLGSPIVAPDSSLAAEGFGDIVVGEHPRGSQTTGKNVDIRGSISIVNPVVAAPYGAPSAILARAGGSDYSRTKVGLQLDDEPETYPPIPGSQRGTFIQMNRWTPAKVVSWTANGRGHTLVCIEERIPSGAGLLQAVGETQVAMPFTRWGTSASVRVLNEKTTQNNIFGASWDQGNVMTSGAGVSAINDPVMHFGGFTGAPRIHDISVRSDDDATIEQGDYSYIIVLEYTDPAGRVWRSLPSDLDTVTTTGTQIPLVYTSECAGSPPGSRKVIYRTKVNSSSPHFRLGSFGYNEVTASEPFVDNTHDDDLGLEILYTVGLVLPNDPPPLGRFITRTRNRFWVGRQEFPARVQSSKFLRPTEGVHWSNADQFSVDIPEAVTGMASMDDTLIVFSEDHIYLVHGDGPTDQGSGGYSSPQTIPSEVGCTQPRGIITSEKGVYFISRRGIELLNRGFSAPIFVGDAVRDITEEFPFCRSAVVLQEAQQIRWLMNTESAGDDGAAVVLVLDTRVNAWSVFRYSVNPTMMGVAPAQLAQHPPDGATFYRQTLGQSTRENTVRNDPEATRKMVWETGELRPAGMIAGAYGRRLHILGTFGTSVDVTIEMAFDDAKDFHPTFIKTWELRAANYSEGDPVQLELTLPVQKFSSCRFRLTADRQTTGINSFQAHGLTVFFDTEGEGPRVGARSKG